MTQPDYKTAVRQYVASKEADVLSVSHTIHRDPELGLQEHRACELLVSTLRESGFEVETPVAGLDTAFVASYRSDSSIASGSRHRSCATTAAGDC